MEPIYFPFTFISPETVQTFSSFFDRFTVYQPVEEDFPGFIQTMGDKDVFNIRRPAKGDNKILLNLLSEFKNWADAHKGKDGLIPGIVKTMKGKIPFFSENSVASIKTDIKKNKSKGAVSSGVDPLLSARLFLLLAQEFDANQWQINDNLRSCENRSNELLKDLKGKDEPFNIDNSLLKEESLEYMIKERMEAWTRLFFCDPFPSPLFITKSRSVLEYALLKAPEAHRIYPGEPDGGMKDEVHEKKDLSGTVLDYLLLHASRPWTGSVKDTKKVSGNDLKDNNHNISFYLVPGQTPHEFFSKWLAKGSFRLPEGGDKKLFNTIMGYVDTET